MQRRGRVVPLGIDRGGFDRYALTINTAGQIAGGYLDQYSIKHDFIRSADGTSFTTFNVPRSTKKSTHAKSINESGAVSGFTDKHRGFERFADGCISLFAAPDANSAGTFTAWNNASGQVLCSYNDASNILHGAVWTP